MSGLPARAEASPRVGFLIGGVQKCGTTALARFLAQHPGVTLPDGKEAHVFDAPDFDDRWSVTQVDARYAPHYAAAVDRNRLHGDATPIYCFHPVLVRRIAAYNPAMRWILILRHPVERAVSHYHMERARGYDRWPMWAAMLLERWRLRGHADDFSLDSPLRRYSYLARGDYARQLDTLYAHFPREQVLLLRNEVLTQAPEKLLARVWRFLGLGVPDGPLVTDRVFVGDYPRVRPGSLAWHALAWKLRRPLRDMRRRHDICW